MIGSWNRGALEVLGYQQEEFVGSPARMLFRPEDRAAGVPEHELARAEADGLASDDRWLLKRDGTRFWASGTTSALRAEDGGFLGFSKVIRDSTTLWEAQDALRVAEERFRLAATSCADLIYERTHSDGTITWFGNVDAALGYQRDGAPRMEVSWAEALHPDDRERVLHGVEQQTELGVPFDEEYRVRRGDGRYAVWSDRGTAVRDATGAVVKWVGVVTDLTEKRRLEDQLHQAQRLESVGRLAGGVAHDRNNMLVASMGYTDFVARSLPPEDRRRADLDQVSRAASRSATLTRQLLAFARRDIIRPSGFMVDALIRDMEGMLHSVVGDRVDLVVALDAPNGKIFADRGQIEQALLSLALNARESMSHGGRLVIETARVALSEDYGPNHGGAPVPAGSYVRIAVSDTGRGMDRELMAHVFEPFYTTKTVGQGTGLGLASVYGSIKQNGGFIWVYSEVDHGSAFKICLPLMAEAVDGTVAEAPSPSRMATETILVVEDETATADANCRALEAFGYTCLRAGDAPSALRVLAGSADRIHLILLDVVLPNTTGAQLGDQLTALFPGIPVLYTSGFTSDDVTRRGLLGPGKAFLQKPYTPAELRAKVRSMLPGG